jgi:hypothetical protein
VHDPDAVVAKTAAWQSGVDFGFMADQEKRRNALIRLKGADGAFNHHATPMIAPHDIHCDAHKQRRVGLLTAPGLQAPAVTLNTCRPL